MKQIRFFGLLSLAVLAQSAMSSMTPMTAFADTAPACGLPVCDIPAAIAALRAGTEGSRWKTITDYRANYKTSTDLAVLHNLADFAQQAEAALAVVYPPSDEAHAYVVRGARDLYGDMVIGLAKYSELDATVLAGYYKQLSGESTRYEVLTYWHNRISAFDSKDSLLALLDFFGKAEKISRDSKDADYLVREAHGDQDVITARLVQIYPYFEGSYKINVSCSGNSGEESPLYCQDNFIDRLVIMDTMSTGGVQVSLANTATGTMMYTFTNVVLSAGGSVFEAQGTPSGVLSQLHIDLDRSTGKITGFIRNTDSLSVLKISGILDATPASVYDLQARIPNKAGLTADMLPGIYKGKYADHDVTLTLVQFGVDTFGGTMSFADQPSFKLRFQASRFYSQLGILVLVANTSSGAHVKMTAFFGKSDKDGSFSVQGFGFTDMSGATQTLNLHSVQN